MKIRIGKILFVVQLLFVHDGPAIKVKLVWVFHKKLRILLNLHFSFLQKKYVGRL
jgi:hypothetical protein